MYNSKHFRNNPTSLKAVFHLKAPVNHATDGETSYESGTNLERHCCRSWKQSRYDWNVTDDNDSTDSEYGQCTDPEGPIEGWPKGNDD